MVQDDKPVGLDALKVKFDDQRAVSDAGVTLVATLAQRLGIEALAGDLVRLRPDRPGAANVGRKVMAVIFAMVLGADSIDDTGVLRAGRTGRLLGGWIPAPSTLGTFLRAFTFGHVRQLDALLGRTLERAWHAGAGPGDGRLVVDVDSFVGEVHGYAKQGAAYGYTKLFGYHPILATRADTREALHIRLRKGSANTQKGMLRFCQELVARVDRAGATGEKLLRADSGFWNTKVFEYLQKMGWQYSIGVRNIPAVKAAVATIDEASWQNIAYPQGGQAQIAETTYSGRRLIVRRTRLIGAQAELWPDWPLRLSHQPHTGHHDRRGRAPRPRRRRAGHRRPQRPGARALPLRRLRRQQRVDRARRDRAQSAPLDAAARTATHHNPRRTHPAPPAAQRPRPPDAPRPRLDAAPPGPLAMARRLPQRAQPHPSTARRRVTAAVLSDDKSTNRPAPGAILAARQHPATLPRKRQQAPRGPLTPPPRLAHHFPGDAHTNSRHPATASVDPG